MENILTGHKSAKWKVYCQVSEDNYIMYRYEDGNVRYAPLYITRFRLIAPRKIMEAQRINKQFSCYEDIETIPDRMRWCRHQKGLMQIELANMVGARTHHITMWEEEEIEISKKVWERCFKNILK